MDDQSKTEIEKRYRYATRNTISSVGTQSGEEAAVASCNGILQGAIDELTIALGPQKAFEIVSEAADRIVKAANVTWTPPQQS